VALTHANRLSCRMCSGGLRSSRVREPMEKRGGIPVLPGKIYTLGVCSRCGLAQVDFEVDQAYLNEAYSTESEVMVVEITGRAPSELSAARIPEFRRVLDLVVEHRGSLARRDALLLDIGCQDGRLLSMAAEMGFRVSGLEPSEEYAEKARRNLPQAVITKGILGDEVADPKADVVTFLETLEHIADPRSALVDVRARTVPGGLIVISVPSWTYFKAKYWLFRVLRRTQSQIHTHITCFSRASLDEVATVLGGTAIYVEPTGWHGPLRFANRIVRTASKLHVPLLRDFGPSLTLVVTT
jgi:2-polyprenyl-3-methyl-5-hydroxy-6-metoxy-1,4-benzoquinol methylase